MITEEAIKHVEELAQIDAFYIETPYSKEKTSRRLDILDYFRRDNPELWNRDKNWLTEDIGTYYNDKYFDVKYPNAPKTPLTAKWIKILTFDAELPQEKYQECAELFEKFDKEFNDESKDRGKIGAEIFKKIIDDAKI